MPSSSVWEGTERERVWREEKKKRYYWGVAGLFFLKLFKLNKIFDSIFSHIRLPDTNNKYRNTTKNNNNSRSS